MNKLSWDRIRAFLVVAQEGSVSAGARKLGLSQPTLSRAIQALERDTGLNLFKRTTQGLQLTEDGRSLVESSERMETAAEAFSRRVFGLSEALEGEVRISANEVVACFLLPAAVAAFRKRHPGVAVEVVVNNRASSLGKREADIALRMFRPEQPNLVARRLPNLSLGFFAHRDYLAQRGLPLRLDELSGHDLIGFDQDMDFIAFANELGIGSQREDFTLRTDHMLVQIELMRAGAGIGVTHLGVAAQDQALVRVLEDVALPTLEFWAVCHSDVQYNSRIREMMRFLGEWFAEDPYRAGRSR